MRTTLLLAALIALPAWAHTRYQSSAGVPVGVANPEDARFLINSEIRPGLRNTSGRLVFPEDSDPVGAIQAAANTWSQAGSRLRISTSPTQLGPNPFDRFNVILSTDTPEVRSVVGGALAVTDSRFFASSGLITDSDIYLNPNPTIPYGTTGAQGTLDLQAIVTHEMGHAIGSSHSTLPTATMFWSYSDIFTRTLSDDDIAFVRSAYPAAGAPPTGTIAGFVTLPSGLPARGAMVTAVDPATGITIGGLTSTVDGSFFINSVTPGQYIVYAEPLDGPAFPEHVGLSSLSVDTNFETSFHQSSSTLVTVPAGGAVNADIALGTRVGALSLNSSFSLARGNQNGAADLFDNQLALELHPGESLDLMFGGPGFDATITENNIQLLGPGIKVRSGSLFVDPFLAFSDGSRILRLTVDIENVERRSVVSLMVRKGNGTVVRSGAYVIQPLPPLMLLSNGVVNAASVSAGALAPNSWVSVFSEKLAQSLVLGIDPLPKKIGGTRVQVVDRVGRARTATLQFVSPGQVNFLMPTGFAAGLGEVQVYTMQGKATATVTIQPVAAGIFSASSSGSGPAAAAYLTVAADNSRTSGFTFNPNVAARPNVPVSLGPVGTQVFLTFYGTGLRSHVQPVTATIGGLAVPVTAAVAQGQFAGLDQINVGPLPRELAGRGQVDVVFDVDGQLTNPVTVSIQ